MGQKIVISSHELCLKYKNRNKLINNKNVNQNGKESSIAINQNKYTRECTRSFMNGLGPMYKSVVVHWASNAFTCKMNEILCLNGSLAGKINSFVCCLIKLNTFSVKDKDVDKFATLDLFSCKMSSHVYSNKFIYLCFFS